MLKVNCFAKIWKIENKGNFTKIQFSTSEKDKRTNEYINYSWNGICVGDANKKIALFSEKDRIKIVDFGVKTRKWNEKTYTEVVIFDVAEVNEQPKVQSNVPSGFEEMDSEFELPF